MAGKRNADASSLDTSSRPQKRQQTEKSFRASVKRATTPRRVTRSMTAAQRAKGQTTAPSSPLGAGVETTSPSCQVTSSSTTSQISDMPSPSPVSSPPISVGCPPDNTGMATALPLPSTSPFPAPLVPSDEATPFALTHPPSLPLSVAELSSDLSNGDWVIMEDAPMDDFSLDIPSSNNFDATQFDLGYFPRGHYYEIQNAQIVTARFGGISSGGFEASASMTAPSGLVFHDPFSTSSPVIRDPFNIPHAKPPVADNEAGFTLLSPRTAIPEILPLPTPAVQLHPIAHDGYLRPDVQLPVEHYDGDACDEYLPSIELAAFHHSTGNNTNLQTTAPLPWVGDLVNIPDPVSCNRAAGLELSGQDTSSYIIASPFCDVLSDVETTNGNNFYNVSRPLDDILADLAPEASVPASRNPFCGGYENIKVGNPFARQAGDFLGAPVPPVPNPVIVSSLPPWRMPQGPLSPKQQASVWDFESQLFGHPHPAQNEVPIDQPWLTKGGEFSRSSWQFAGDFQGFHSNPFI